MTRRVDVLGPLPPPYGGVSIHIIRFLELLRAEKVTAVGHPYTGTTRQGKLGKMIQAVRMLSGLYTSGLARADDVLHLHYGGLGYFLAIAPILARTKARKVVTFHSVRVIQDLEGKPGWIRRWALAILRDFDLFVPVRGEIGEELGKLGLVGPDVTVMPAFLPPADEECDLGRLPDSIAMELADGMRAGRQQVCCAAYYLGPGYGKDDLYGIEELMAAVVTLDDGQDWDLWILVSNRPETTAQKSAEANVLAAAARLKNIRLRLYYGLPLIPVMARCGAFLRPSREDGDSVAVREALSMGLPVLASDIVNRPEQVVTFSLSGVTETATALHSFMQNLTLLGPGEVHTILRDARERFRHFVHEVLGDSIASE